MSLKRVHEEESIQRGTKRCKIELSDEQRLINFNDWMSKHGFQLNKVSVTNKNVCSGWGLVADDNIKCGEVLFMVPKQAYLRPENSELNIHLDKAKDGLGSNSGWVPLLLTLMYEYTKENSQWKPYFDMVPKFQDFDMPMFWDEDEINTELQGTALKEAISKDSSSLTEEFKTIVMPFLKQHETLFNLSHITLELFKKMVAFVMAYSFTEPSLSDDDDDNDDDSDCEEDSNVQSNPPIMVPLADILNHVSRNNARLEFKQDCLNMIAIKDINKGEEVFNTYGELSNEQLLHMYGYAEDPLLAVFDTVDASSKDLFDILLKEDPLSEALLKKKWNFLTKTGCIPSDGCFVLGVEGVLTEEQLMEVFKVIPMNSKEFSIMEDKDEWMSDDEDDTSLSIENISKLDSRLKKIFHMWIYRIIEKYPKSLEDEQNYIRNACVNNNCKKSKRKLCSAYVRCGQLQILKRYIDLTK